MSRPGSSKRRGLTRERVLEAAIELADAEGLQALSMRRLAGALGVEAMTLYHHVGRKEDLLGAMIDRVVDEFEPASAGGPWQEAIRRSATSAHESLMRHRWACGLYVSRGKPIAGQLRWMEQLLRCLREAGFSVELAHYAYHALDSHIVGFTLWLQSFPFSSRDEMLEMGRQVLADMPADLPFTAEHIRYHLDPSSAAGQSAFDFGLELILDGLERRRR